MLPIVIKVVLKKCLKTLSLFGAMVHSSFGNLVEDDWVQDIHNFCSNYRALPGTTS